MTREEALEAVRDNIKNENTIKHMLATEAIMRSLAAKFSGDEDEWGLAGLLHDIDLDLVGEDMSSHAKLGADMVRDLGVSEEIARAILCHNEALGLERTTDMERALFCADPLTGLITAAALVRPDRSLGSVEPKSIRKRFKEKSFAAGANREQISCCSELGMELDEFLELGLRAMQGISADLGL